MNQIGEGDNEEEYSESEWINKVSDLKSNTKMVKCVMEIDQQTVKFQIDTGSSVNILPVNFLKNKHINKSDLILKTWNSNNYKPLGECRIKIKNPKNNKKYSVNFVICEENFTPIIGLSASKQMKLVELKDKILNEYTK